MVGSVRGKSRKSSARERAGAPRVVDKEVAALRRDLKETRKQQAATTQVLKAIGSSAFDLQAVLDTLTETAAKLSDADMAAIARSDERGFYHATNYNFAVDWVRITDVYRLLPGRGSVIGRALLEKRAVQIVDVLADPEYSYSEMQEAAGYRTLLGVPLMRGTRPIGALFLGRKTVHPFNKKQVDVVSTFADQAVIAIENARLFDEVQTKTRDLEETLQQQTATAEVLQIISSSPGELQLVFDKMLENATQVCSANFGTMTLFEDGAYRTVAVHGVPEAYLSQMQLSFRPHPKSGLGQLAHTRDIVHIADLRLEEPYLEGDPAARALVDLAQARTLVIVPMLKEKHLVGAIAIFNQQVRPFTDKQVELLGGFAKQAVIAIENTRLLTELRERTDDLTRSLQ